MSRGDVLVGVCLYPDGHPDHHVLHDPGATGNGVEPVDLDHRVQYYVADAGLDRSGEFVDGLVVAVQCDPLGWESGVQRDGKFAAAGDVE